MPPKDYERGDLLLTVLDTEPRMLLCLERARSHKRGPDIDVEGDRVVFTRLLAVSSVERLAGVQLPPAPVTLSEVVARSVLEALARALAAPDGPVDPTDQATGASCSISTGIQAAVFMAGVGVCCACGRDFGSLLGGQGIHGLEVHRVQEDPDLDLVVLCGGCHLLAHSVGSPSAQFIRMAWRPSCPACGAHPPNEILWGMPIWPVDDPSITLGGCVVDGNPPRWHCTSCAYQWGSGA